jgi:membrane-anchored protein YejM (alkaline phosphatase superfamily)
VALGVPLVLISSFNNPIGAKIFQPIVAFAIIPLIPVAFNIWHLSKTKQQELLRILLPTICGFVCATLGIISFYAWVSIDRYAAIFFFAGGPVISGTFLIRSWCFTSVLAAHF